MPLPEDKSQPRLAAGCRWSPPTEGRPEQERMILFPEGAIKLQGTGREILERCDGIRTFGEIVADLEKQFAQTDAEKIRADIARFLEQLQKKRIVDY
jgi:coenzyme PQQ biosynthesis protein PqqD